jgi:UDP-N-acetylmuramate--alanine ligase
MFSAYRKFHFVGIGGIGMCGLAEVLHQWGYQVSGSDLNPSENTRHLEKLGIRVSYGHHADNLADSEILIYTSAAASDNPELVSARKKGLKAIKRAELLGQIFSRYQIRIAISGTHGKSTTTGLVASVFIAAQQDPLVIGGGLFKDSRSPVRIGQGESIIVEADEFDRSFLRLYPSHAIVTTIEAEHLDCYASLEDLKSTFLQFIQQVDSNGVVVVCIDEPAVAEIYPQIQRKVITYGLSDSADFNAKSILVRAGRTDFEIYERGVLAGKFQLQLTGAHNVKNALAAVAVARYQGIDWMTIRAGLGQFQGIRRRMEVIYQNEHLILMDDYAHHPTEIEATLKGVRQAYGRRVIAVFQPHLYSRTRDFAKDFARALKLADVVILMEIYPAREAPIPGVTSQLIFDELTDTQAVYVHSLPEAITHIQEIFRPGDLIVTLGAGNVNMIIPQLKELLMPN